MVQFMFLWINFPILSIFFEKILKLVKRLNESPVMYVGISQENHL